MSTAKELITEIVQKQPDDSSYDEIVRELAFDLMVQRARPQPRLVRTPCVGGWSGQSV
jgi:hypothetical protein